MHVLTRSLPGTDVCMTCCSVFGAQHFGNVKVSDMSMCCLCRLDLTADVGSGSQSQDSMGQHDESARQHSCQVYAVRLCILFHAAQHRKVSNDHRVVADHVWLLKQFLMANAMLNMTGCSITYLDSLCMSCHII